MKRFLAWACLVFITACSDPVSQKTTERLASRARFSAVLEHPAAWTIGEGQGDGLRFVEQINEAEQIEEFHFPGAVNIYQSSFRVTGFGGAPLNQETGEPGPHNLTDANGTYQFVPLTQQLYAPETIAKGEGLVPGSFTVFKDRLFFNPFDGKKPKRVTYTARIAPAIDSHGNPRIDYDNSSFEGFCVLAGEFVELGEITWSPEAELVFDLAVAHAPLEQAFLNIEVSGKSIASIQLGLVEAREPVRIKLPTDSVQGELSFAVTHASAAALILAPAITRSKSESAPDFAIFLADTFRADNLAFYGGDPLVAPEMNAFAASATRFESAWSPASWTLPAHTSLFTGLMPPDHGVVHETASLDERYQTLAEVMHQAGWRTVAITEGGFVVPEYGIDQGFERFIVGPARNLDATLASVKRELANDDGRPLFLFVQSFRAHSPYLATPAAMEQLEHIFEPDQSPDDWVYEQMVEHINADIKVPNFLTPKDGNGQLPEAALRHPELARLFTLYRGGAADTSRGFGEFLTLLDANGLENANLILTSDHAEAFGEQGTSGHANSVFEACIKIPLLIRFDGRTPHTASTPVSLIDLAPTILEVADLAPPAAWQGISLVPAIDQLGTTDTGPTRAIASFECPTDPSRLPAEAALRVGRNKAIASFDLDSGQIQGRLRAYDLAADPGEKQLDSSGSAASRAVQDELRARIEANPKPHFTPLQRNLSEADKARLRELGYLGDD